jgi:hypothetical protein
MHVGVIFWIQRIQIMGELDESFGAWTAVWRSNDLTIHNSAAPSQHRFGSVNASMTRQQHHATTNIDSVAPSQHDLATISPAWLGHDITSLATLTWQRPHRHDFVATSQHSQHRLSSAVTSMTWGHGTYFPDQQSYLKVHHRSDLGARKVLFWQSIWLRDSIPFSSTDDPTRALKEYHSNRQSHSDTLLPTSPTLIRDKRINTNNNMRYFVKWDKSYS